MSVSPGVRVATVITRSTRSCAPFIGALLAGVQAIVFLSSLLLQTLPVLAFKFSSSAPFRLISDLRLCVSASLCL